MTPSWSHRELQDLSISPGGSRGPLSGKERMLRDAVIKVGKDH